MEENHNPGVPPLRYGAEESWDAWSQWGANGGPHSLAAACELTLEDVRRALPDFQGWMSIKDMEQTLLRLRWTNLRENIEPKSRISWVRDREKKQAKMIRTSGRKIARIQWEGEWLDPGVPHWKAKGWTHWVAQRDGYILDTVICAIQWVPAQEWLERIQAFCQKENYRGWYFTDWFTIRKATI
jgi:hypothetical protein